MTKERSFKENGGIDTEVLYNNGKTVKELSYWKNGNKKTEVIHINSNEYSILEYNKDGILKIRKSYNSITKIIKTELFSNSGKNIAIGFGKRFFDKFDLAICFDKKNGLLAPNSENFNFDTNKNLLHICITIFGILYVQFNSRCNFIEKITKKLRKNDRFF